MTRRTRSVVLIATGIVAAFLYSNFLLDWALRGFGSMGQVVSFLEAPGQKDAGLLRVTDVICALLVVALLPAYRSALPAGRWSELAVWSIVVFALGATMAAIVSEPCAEGLVCESASDQLSSSVHDLASLVSDSALYVGVAAAWWTTRHTGPAWFRRSAWWGWWIGGVGTSLLFGYFNATRDPLWAVGATQRLHIVVISLWIVAMAVLAARDDLHPERRSAD